MLWCLNTSWYLSLTANQQQNEHGHTQGKPERGPGKKKTAAEIKALMAGRRRHRSRYKTE
jgi:hypothetical protein